MKIDSLEFLRPLVGSRDRTDLWTRILRQLAPAAMAEIGVWKGDFARDMLAACPSIRQYHMIDPWARLPDWNKPFNVSPEAFDEVYAEAMAKTAFAADKLNVLRGRTSEVIDAIPDGSLDFAYVDGDHTLRGITIDLIRLLPKMREGAIIGGDDFTNTPWQHDPRFEPTLVCPFAIYFAEAHGLPIISLPGGQYAIQNTRQGGFRFFDTVGEYADVSLNRAMAR